MARPKPDPRSVIPEIRQQAIELLKEHGFDRLTMRALAARCGMSVGKLYQFFPSKDALFLSLEIEYFNGLKVCLEKSLAMSADSKRAVDSDQYAFRQLLGAYYNYASEHFALYKLVTAPPKVFTHYLGTGDEALARDELHAALSVVNLVRSHFQIATREKEQGDTTFQQRFLLTINCMHGIILLSHSPAWPYISSHIQSESELSVETAHAQRDRDVQLQLDLLVERMF